MKIKLRRQDEKFPAERVDIYIGDTMYRITETIEGKLNINKSGENLSDSITIYPVVTNVIEIK